MFHLPWLGLTSIYGILQEGSLFYIQLLTSSHKKKKFWHLISFSIKQRMQEIV